MALLVPSTFPSTPKFQMKPLRSEPFQIHRFLILHAYCQISPTCSMKVAKAHFSKPSKNRLQLNIVKKSLCHAIPDSLKQFPWRKAKDVLLQRLLIVGKKLLKWSFTALFIFSSLTDITYSISRNQELMIPFGLLVGCLMTNFLKEISQEFFEAPEKKFTNLPLLGISCIFVMFKVISTYFTPRTPVFLLHFANGGLLQILWLWRNSLRKTDQHSEETFCNEQN